jgi:hypothetical protein
MERVIFEKFGLAYPPPPIIKEWDDMMITPERDSLLTFHPDWDCPEVGLPVEVEAWPWRKAEHEFMKMFNQLFGHAS